MIETMAINELEQRRKRLEEYQVKARFAMAESYDRATKAQQDKVRVKEAVQLPDDSLENVSKPEKSSESKSQEHQESEPQSGSGNEN